MTNIVFSIISASRNAMNMLNAIKSPITPTLAAKIVERSGAIFVRYMFLLCYLNFTAVPEHFLAVQQLFTNGATEHDVFTTPSAPKDTAFSFKVSIAFCAFPQIRPP